MTEQFCGLVRLDLVNVVRNKICLYELLCFHFFLMDTKTSYIIYFAALSHLFSFVATSVAKLIILSSALSGYVFMLLDVLFF